MDTKWAELHILYKAMFRLPRGRVDPTRFTATLRPRERPTLNHSHLNGRDNARSTCAPLVRYIQQDTCTPVLQHHRH
jgi:hypothetical protein